MAVERVLHCDDGEFAGWTSITQQSPSVIEQIPAAAHDGAAGNHIVVNEDNKRAYANLENWASPMALGELRAIGHWWKILTSIPAGPLNTAVIVTVINGLWAAVLMVNPDNEVSLITQHDGGFHVTDYTPLFTGTEWHHVRLVLIRHATAGGSQLWDGDNLLIDDALYDTTNRYNGTPDLLHAGCFSAVPAGFETCQDEFRIATTLAEAEARAVSLSLWHLVPFIIRYRDSIVQGSPDAEGNFQKIMYMLEEETSVTAEEIADLATLVDADTADPDFLLFLSATLGTMVDSRLGVPFQRWFTKNLVNFYKIKGTHLSWDKQFYWLLGRYLHAYELWKSKENETTDYDRMQDAGHTMKAARIDLYEGDDASPNFLDIVDAIDFMPYIESVRPIHVLLRRNARTITPTSNAFVVDSGLDGSSIVATFEEDVHGVADNFLFSPVCLTTCELACQAYCEVNCMAACQIVSCQQECTTYNEFNCDVECNSVCEGDSCQGSCQAASCQSGCQTCGETEIFMAEIKKVEEAEEDDDREPDHDDLKPQARIYFPEFLEDGGEADEDYWVTLDEEDEYKKLRFSWRGPDEDCYIKPNPNDKDHKILLARIEEGDWYKVIVKKDEEQEEEHSDEGDGERQEWEGNLGAQPHPCDFRIIADLMEVKTTCSGGNFTLTIADDADLNEGDAIAISSDVGSEVNMLIAVGGGSGTVKCPLEHSYTDAELLRPRKIQTAFVVSMQEPASDTEWKGDLGGDVDDSGENFVNFRGDFDLKVKFKEPPPDGAKIKAYYYKEEDCEYHLIDTLHADWQFAALEDTNDVTAGKLFPVKLELADGLPGSAWTKASYRYNVYAWFHQATMLNEAGSPLSPYRNRPFGMMVSGDGQLGWCFYDTTGILRLWHPNEVPWTAVCGS